MSAHVIAIVGVGARFAGARDAHAFWDVTRAGRASFGPVPASRWRHDVFFDANTRARDKSYAPTGAWIEDVETFPAQTLQMPPRRVEVTDPQQRLALECAIDAIEDAGFAPDGLPRRTGVYMGVTAVEYRTLASSRVVAQLMASGALGEGAMTPEEAAVLSRAVDRVIASRPYTAPGVLSNMVAATVAQELRLHGPAFSTDAACASSLVALHAAVMALRAGQIDAALAGGVYLCLTPEHHIAFSRIGAISKQGACLPFDARADGFVQGDGCGVLLLKRLEDAHRDGDRVLATIRGIAMNNDGGGAGPMAPVKEGQIEVIRAAWDDAGLSPEGLGYVESHGTGTLVGDHIEFDGLVEALGRGVRRAAIGSTKANFGHTMSAAGVCGVLRAALALSRETIPPMAGFVSPKADLPLAGSPFFIPTAPEPWTGAGRLACVSSFGFGGTNGHVVLAAPEEADAVAAPYEAASQAELFVLSAGTPEALRRLAGETATALSEDPKATLAGAVRSATRRRRLDARLAVTAASLDELVATLSAFARGDLPKNATTGVAAGAPRIAFVYPGQGAQRVGMLAGIRDRFPRVRAALDDLDAASAGTIARPITHYLYPERRPEHRDGAPVDLARASDELTATENCQPALFAVGYALSELLASVGVRPSVVAGHSVGEFTAAAVAGLMSPAEGLRWCARRGQGMQDLGGDPGAMAAIVATPAAVAPLLAEGARLANINHPRQVVVSGFTEAVRETVARARAANLEVTELRVSHGFHSAVFDGLDLDAVVDAIPMTDASVPVASCITAATYSDPTTARAIYKQHARSPVDWVGAIGRCCDAGATLFVQVAAGGPLVSFIRGARPDVPVVSIASREDADGGRSFLDGLGQLFVRGVDLDLDAITAEAPLLRLPASILPRERYWVIGDQPVDAPLDFSALVGGEAPARARSTRAGPTDAAKGVSAPETLESASDPRVEVVFAAVAKASAYPRAALKPTMRLGDDLGFDSMMVADFVEELRRQLPGFPGLPQELLARGPSIQAIVDHVLTAPTLAAGDSGADDEAPLATLRPARVRAPRPPWAAKRAMPAGRFHRMGPPSEAGLALSAELTARGWKEVCVVSASNPAKGLDLLIVDALGETRPTLAAVLAREVAAPERTAALHAVMTARFGDPATAARDGFALLHVHHDDDLWAAGVAGYVRSAAREWSTEAVHNLAVAGGLSPATIAAEALATLEGCERTPDVGLDDDGRYVSGLAPVPESEAALHPLGPSDAVLVTGGTRGIGLKLATRLAAVGVPVTIAGRSVPATLPAGVTALSLDLSDPDAVARTLTGQPFNVLVHAAGLLADGPLGRVPPETAAAAMTVKVDGLLAATRALAPTLTRVLALGSWAGRLGNRNQAPYGAANAAMAAVVEALPERIAGVVAEFGPWTDSDMVRAIPPAIQAAMRAEGVDFAADGPGLDALMDDLRSRGVRVHGRPRPDAGGVPRFAAADRVARQTVTVARDRHAFLEDHAIGGAPVLPLAWATSLAAETSGPGATFEIKDFKLYAGVVATTPKRLSLTARGEQVELFSAEADADGHGTLSYAGRVAHLADPASVAIPARPDGGAPSPLPLSRFYGGLTFHGPRFQGITAIEAVGADFIRGRVKVGGPDFWRDGDGTLPAGLPAGGFAVDPLAFDSAMQLAATVALVRWSRAGTPTGFDRLAVLRPWPAAGAELEVAAHFIDAESDVLSADLVFRHAGEVIAAAFGVRAEMRKVEVDLGLGAPSKPDTMSGNTATPAPEAPAFVVRPEWVDPSRFKGYKDIAMRLAGLSAMGLKNPYFDVHDGTARDTSSIGGREVINFSSYNYLGYSGDPRVLAEVEVAVRRYGTSVSASRVASGERPFHRDLEAALAEAHGCEDALVMPGGHATNVNTIGHLFNSKDLILHDELIHDSCLQGIKLSGAARRSFRHEDLGHLESQLRELRPHYEKVLILVEGVYSMDGDLADLPGYIALKRRYGCLLMVDEAHSFGTIGRTGRGLGEHFGLDDPNPPDGLSRRDVDIWMGTMSKSLASMGGWVAGSKELILYLRYTTPGFVFAAGIPPALGVAALSSVRLMREEPARVAQLQTNAKRFFELLRERGIDTGPATGDSPVIPVITGDSMWALLLSDRLLAQGINAKPIIFPAVANDAARLRFFMTATHTEAQLVETADRIRATLDQIKAESQPKPRAS